MIVSYQIYEQSGDVLLAACDKGLLGDTLEEGDISLEVKEDFYGGNLIEIEPDSERTDLDTKFERSTIANLVGENVVEAALDAGLGDEKDVMWIQGIPHLQIVHL